MSAAEDGMRAEDVSQKMEDPDGIAAVHSGSVVTPEKQDAPSVEPPEADEFGLPLRPPRRRRWTGDEDEREVVVNGKKGEEAAAEEEEFHDAAEKPEESNNGAIAVASSTPVEDSKAMVEEPGPDAVESSEQATDTTAVATDPVEQPDAEAQRPRAATLDDIADRERPDSKRNSQGPSSPTQPRKAPNVSEWSHQALAPREAEKEPEQDEDEWQAMPAFATHRIYDDWGKVLAREYDEIDEDQQVGYGKLGGAGKGYTRVQDDEDAESATSMDDHTAYLFKEPHQSNALDEDEEGRDVVSQMQTTKELLTEGQRIAYVGLVRLSIGKMLDIIRTITYTKATRKQIDFAMEAMKMWGQKMMVRLYAHMDIDSAEQVMVEQLAEHGVLPEDLTPALMLNARVRNPANADKVESETSSLNASARPSVSSPRPSTSSDVKGQNLSRPPSPVKRKPQTPPPPPPAYKKENDTLPPTYEEHTASQLTAQNPSEIEDKKNLDIDIRWTILCDLFLLLLADSTYDSRSRVLLEHVGLHLSVPWQEICRFEKRVTDALEMQEQADKENWNESEHLEARRKAARNKRLMVMGLCTVGGGLIIGLSAGALAPVIGAGLASGFTLIGVSGTGTFLGGAGAAAMIGGGGALTGGIIGGKASNRRTGAVKTFEYRPLFNNKRPHLIVTVAGWMTGKVDDVRLPFSTVDPVMGDMYSIHWEPEMLTSTGQTIQILATEALTQTIQQILGMTILTGLMAGLNLPIVLTKLSYLIDNPWTVSLARADASGLILADSLIDRNLGVRPVTLVGFSLGARLIFVCLKELAKRGALGLVQNVYLFGSPIIAKRDEYIAARTVVSGRFVNGYATNDWILGYLFRATSGGIMRVAGLKAVDVAGIENKDCTQLVPGHMAYRGMMPHLLEEVGWLVDGLEFSEIEDPDPENHEKRQRELISEIETARQELEDKQAEKAKKGGFKAFFSRRGQKSSQKKEWETYDERSQKVLEGDEKVSEQIAEESQDVMFDVDAIRMEALKLAMQGEDVEEIKMHLRIREIESTMPALRVESSSLHDANGTANETANGSGSELGQTKSLDGGRSAAQTNGAVVVAETEVAAPETWPKDDGRAEEESKGPIPLEGAGHRSTVSADVPNGEPSRPDRPALRSISTAPPPEIQSPDHNPWSDEDEFGKEKEVSMSFE